MVALLAAVLVLAVSSDRLHGLFVSYLPAIQDVIRARPVWGVSIFVLFAAAAAMLAFVSSALIVPVGVYVWGTTASVLLLWAGWILGGICAYGLSRGFGRRLVEALGAAGPLERYERYLSGRAPFVLVVLFQLAVPSEVPGYLLGLLRYRFGKYVAALALAELPYAIGTIYMGVGFVERRTRLLVGVGAGLAVFSALALYTLHRRLGRAGQGGPAGPPP